MHKSANTVFSLLVLAGLGGCAHFSRQGTAEFSFLRTNPALRAEVLRWQRNTPPEVKRAIRALRSNDWRQRRLAAEDDSVDGQACVLTALSMFRDPCVVPALIEVLKDPNTSVWEHVPPGNKT